MLIKMTAALAATLALIAPFGAGAGYVAGSESAKLTTPRKTAPRVARLPHDSSTCTGAGANSFVGGGTVNNAYGISTAILGGSTNTVCDDYSTVAGGIFNSISTAGFDRALYSFIAGGDDNAITGPDSLIGAGSNNKVSGELSADVAGANNDVTGNAGFIGSGSSNQILTSASATIGGGYSNTIVAQNVGGTAYSGGSYSFIGGGWQNSILGNQDGVAMYSSIGGGYKNAITGAGGTIAGGELNVASGTEAAVAGGIHNTASNAGAFVGGGSGSSATGQFSTVPGGYLNAANGTGSFAAGTLAKARTNGAFVWSDNSSGNALQSTAPYQFLARAAGGFYLYSNSAATSGVKLAPGSGAWSSLSDRNMKNDIVPLDDATVLAKVASLPVSEWSYNSERGVRHVGPMAQDFYAAFRVGEDDRHITSIDEDGVALAAIKALHAENASLHAENAALHAETASLKEETSSLKDETLSLRGKNTSLAAGISIIGQREAALQREVARLAVASRAARGR